MTPEPNSIRKRARTYAKKGSARSDEVLNIDRELLAGSRETIANTRHRFNKKRKMQLVALVIRLAERCCSGICNKQTRMMRWVQNTYGSSVNGFRNWNDTVTTPSKREHSWRNSKICRMST